MDDDILKQCNKLKIGIVGARNWAQERQVEWYIRDLPHNVCIVSGGANGVDKMAADYAKKYDIECHEILPDLAGCKERYEFTKRYYERNQKIVDNVDFLVAFVNKDYGGTWDTIRRAYKKPIPVKIFKPSLFIGYIPQGELDLQKATKLKEGSEVNLEEPENAKKIGKGPFQMRRVSLGSYALHLKRYIETNEWAEFLHGKDNFDSKLIDRMADDFIKFFRKNKMFGRTDFLTVAPRSIRHLEKPHIMDAVLEKVANELGVEAVVLFNPWDKKGRGRFAKRGEISVNEKVKDYIGKVGFVIDDVATTNFTLKSSVEALMSLEIHCHGIAWCLMA